jgi:prepilin-type processing-associated H-X9-DG protein
LKIGDDPAFWKSRLYQTNQFTGVIYLRSETKLTELANGTSNTYLIGEKYLTPNRYYNGADEGDDEAMLIGMDNCISRCTASPPLPDTAYLSDGFRFGSAHASGCYMLYADGRVELVAYSIDPTVHRKAGNRFGR